LRSPHTWATFPRAAAPSGSGERAGWPRADLHGHLTAEAVGGASRGGFRQAHADLSNGIAERGYVVLTPNIFYRTTKPPAFEFEPDFPSERAVNRFRELTGPFTPDAMVRAGLGLHRLPRHAASRQPRPDGRCRLLLHRSVRPAHGCRAARSHCRVASFHTGGLVTDTD
jgi:carboxymethylenebutenolidase